MRGKPENKKPCVICGELFLPEKPSSRICSKNHYSTCPVCGKSIEWNSTRKVEPCSKECRRELTRKRNLEKYGVEHPMQNKEVQKNFRNSMKEKYGVEHALQSSELRSKAIKTNQEKFGTDWALGNKKIRKKISETMTEKYGAPTTLQSSVLRHRVEETCLSRYGIKEVSSNLGLSTTSYLMYKIKYERPEICLIEKSAVNLAFADMLESFGLKTDVDVSIDENMYDIRILNSNIFIEIDPSYTHNTLGNHWTNKGLNKNYHKLKSDLASKYGYRCIHIFDWDGWEDVIEIVRTDKTRIPARKCSIYKLTNKAADAFLNENHLQGTVIGQLLCLGLIYEGELVEVMTFGLPRYNKNYSMELLRLCTKKGFIVMGGAEKLFKFATEKFYVENIISYCDASKFSGDVYTRLGMKLVKRTEPQEVWSKGDRKITANLLRQRGYDQLFGTDHGKGTSNEELMYMSGWLPVYDCGQYVYEF